MQSTTLAIRAARHDFAGRTWARHNTLPCQSTVESAVPSGGAATGHCWCCNAWAVFSPCTSVQQATRRRFTGSVHMHQRGAAPTTQATAAAMVRRGHAKKTEQASSKAPKQEHVQAFRVRVRAGVGSGVGSVCGSRRSWHRRNSASAGWSCRGVRLGPPWFRGWRTE